MNYRASTMAAMVAALQALDDRARDIADFHKGFAAGLKASGLASEPINAATDTDNGRFEIDTDGREVWRVLP